MEDIKHEVDKLEQYLQTIIENYAFLKGENSILYNKLSVLENQLKKERQMLTDLQETYNLLTIAKTIGGDSNDKQKTNLKINELIREIDACVTQLKK